MVRLNEICKIYSGARFDGLRSNMPEDGGKVHKVNYSLRTLGTDATSQGVECPAGNQWRGWVHRFPHDWCQGDLEADGEEMPLPCIVHWNQRHFVVVYDVVKKHGVYKVMVADPASGLLEYRGGFPRIVVGIRAENGRHSPDFKPTPKLRGRGWW